MLKDITLGQYFPGSSVIHRLDARTKLLLLTVYIVALFVSKSFLCYGIVAAFLAFQLILSKIKLVSLLRGLKPVVIILIFTGVLNLLFTDGEVLLSFWKIKITREGIITAIMMVSRVILLIMGTFLLTYTTSPIALTDGLEALFKPLKKIKVPVHELSMMMSIALRFIPTLIEETDKIMSAQKARGASFDTGNVIEKAKSLLPLLVPLFISAFRRADELAVAMECRCYHGDNGRTRMKQLKMTGSDFAALTVGAAALASVIVLTRFGL